MKHYSAPSHDLPVETTLPPIPPDLSIRDIWLAEHARPRPQPGPDRPTDRPIFASTSPIDSEFSASVFADYNVNSLLGSLIRSPLALPLRERESHEQKVAAMGNSQGKPVEFEGESQ